MSTDIFYVEEQKNRRPEDWKKHKNLYQLLTLEWIESNEKNPGHYDVAIILKDGVTKEQADYALSVLAPIMESIDIIPSNIERIK